MKYLPKSAIDKDTPNYWYPMRTWKFLQVRIFCISHNGTWSLHTNQNPTNPTPANINFAAFKTLSFYIYQAHLISETDKQLRSANIKQKAFLSIFLTRGIKVSFPALRDTRSRNSKLQKATMHRFKILDQWSMTFNISHI